MKVRRPNVTSTVTSIVVVVVIGTLAACGAVGAPIPPENVGVTPTIERQKRLEALQEKQREAAVAAEGVEPQADPLLQGQDVDLPTLQPVGTR
jgi:predicted small lipoprotein YifL